MALSKEQYFNMGHRDAQTTPPNRNGALIASMSWQGRAYAEGYSAGELHQEANAIRAQACPACAAGIPFQQSVDCVQSIAPGAARRADRIQALTRGYISAMLWTTTDDDGNECQDMEVTPEGRAEVLAIVTAFYDANHVDLGAYVDLRMADVGSTYRVHASQQTEAYGFAGHDLWLTSQGHGVGFWDRGHGRVGERLTKAAKAFQGCDAYTTDDGYVDLSIPYHASWKKV